MGANLPFYVVANILWLWVLPALEHELETVAVRIEYICRIVTRIILEPCGGRAIIGSTRRNRRGIGRTALDHALAQPEGYLAFCVEALQVGVPRRPILAVVIEPIGDTERRQRLAVEGDRTSDVAHR
jgi:hypothetical protein